MSVYCWRRSGVFWRLRASLGLACAQAATLCTQVVGRPRPRPRAARPRGSAPPPSGSGPFSARPLDAAFPSLFCFFALSAYVCSSSDEVTITSVSNRSFMSHRSFLNTNHRSLYFVLLQVPTPLPPMGLAFRFFDGARSTQLHTVAARPRRCRLKQPGCAPECSATRIVRQPAYSPRSPAEDGPRGTT